MQTNFNSIEQALASFHQATKKKILFACVPGDGHFNPLTSIAKHLIAQGYDVRWYTSAAYSEKLGKLKIPHFPYVKALEVTGANVEEVFPEREKIKSPVAKLNYDIINFFIKRGPEYYEDMMSIKESFDFDIVVADCLFTGIPFITDKMNIPVVSIGIVPLTENSRDLAPTGLAMTPDYSRIGRMKQGLLRFFATNILFRKANNYMRQVMNEYNIEHKGVNLFDFLIKKSTILLQSGTPGFEYTRSDMGSNIRFIGSVLPYAEPNHETQWFDRRLNQFENIILVTQGTVEKDVEKLIVPTLEAFKNSNHLVVVTTGGSRTKELRLRYPQPNFIIEDFIPFNDIMPYADVYISNGGYGGVLLGIENRLPMVVAGVHEGKNEINARIGYFNLGINLKTETPSPAQMHMAVAEVLGNSIYRSNVESLAAEFRQYATSELAEKYIRETLGGMIKKTIPASNNIAA